jgi:ferritin
MISQAMTEAVNAQINAEIYSAYMYQAMSAAAAHAGLSGIANWLSMQTMEELTHAQKFYAYLLSQGARVELAAIDAPPKEYDGAVAIFEAVLAHEQKVTALINDLANLAADEKDHATGIFLQWFVSEQVEEEEHAGDILAKLKLAGATGGGLFMIDKELGARTFAPPAAEAE